MNAQAKEEKNIANFKEVTEEVSFEDLEEDFLPEVIEEEEPKMNILQKIGTKASELGDKVEAKRLAKAEKKAQEDADGTTAKKRAKKIVVGAVAAGVLVAVGKGLIDKYSTSSEDEDDDSDEDVIDGDFTEVTEEDESTEETKETTEE